MTEPTEPTDKPSGHSNPQIRNCFGNYGGLANTRHMLALVVAALMLAGCVTSNHDFDALPDARGQVRTLQLVDDLKKSQRTGSDSELYDLRFFPLVHLGLKVFAEADDDFPAGYIEAEVASYLPLFGFLTADISRYADDHSLYEQHNFNSYLWGLFQSHREEITTPVGLREERQYRLFWFLGLGGNARYQTGR